MTRDTRDTTSRVQVKPKRRNRRMSRVRVKPGRQNRTRDTTSRVQVKPGKQNRTSGRASKPFKKQAPKKRFYVVCMHLLDRSGRSIWKVIKTFPRNRIERAKKLVSDLPYEAKLVEFNVRPITTNGKMPKMLRQ